jgi:hypothetical protein
LPWQRKKRKRNPLRRRSKESKQSRERAKKKSAVQAATKKPKKKGQELSWSFPGLLEALAGTNAADSPGLQARVDPQTFGTEERLPQQHEATPPQAVKQFYKNLIFNSI